MLSDSEAGGCWWPGGCFTNVSRALQNILSKFVYCGNTTCDENFKLKLCTCAQSHALGTRTKFQLEIHTVNVISGVVYFREIILESSRNVSEITPWCHSFSYLGSSMCSYSWTLLALSCESLKIFFLRFKIMLMYPRDQ